MVANSLTPSSGATRALSRVEETPFFFGDGLFGVIYRPAPCRPSGWVVCNPFGSERTRAHRVLVELARCLAADGSCVLRFDYRGTGDSLGDFGDYSIDDYLDDIDSAVAQLEQVSGVRCGGLIGLRLGADLAALSSSRHGTRRDLVLWEPIVNGTRYQKTILRTVMANEMTNSSGVHRTRTDLKRDLAAGRSVSVDGFAVSSLMFDSLHPIDLNALGRPDSDAILFVQSKAAANPPVKPDIAKLIGAYSTAEETDFLSIQAPSPWIQSRSFRWHPGSLFDDIASWIRSRDAKESVAEANTYAEGPQEASPAGRHHERPVGFDVDGDRVWGVLHEPLEPREGAPGVMMIAAGEACRTAFFYPALARRLARHGLPVLRFDPRGIGDSNGTRDYDRLYDFFYGVEAGVLVPDTIAALDFFERECGINQILLIGLCGGAVTAVLASKTDLRVVGIVTLELPMRLTPRSDPNDGRRFSSQVPWVEVLSRRRGAFFLLRLRRLFHIVKNIGRRAALIGASLRPRHGTQPPGDRRWFQDTIGDDASVSMFEGMTSGLERGVAACCVFADTEQPRLFHEILPGLTARIPESQASVESHVIRGADHNFIMPGCSASLAEAVISWIDGTFGSQTSR